MSGYETGLVNAKASEPRLTDRLNDRICKRKRLFRGIGRRIEACQVSFLVSKAAHRRGKVLGDEVLVAFPFSPNVVDGLSDRRPQASALWISIRSIIGPP